MLKRAVAGTRFLPADVVVEARSLGRSGLRVSAIALGTVSLGADYGIRAPGAVGVPEEEAARAVLHHARARAVTLFDTAPAYGSSEELVGSALGDDRSAVLATKISIPTTDSDVDLRRAVRASVEASARKLRRSRLDLVQIHNATERVIERGVLAAELEKLRIEGRISEIGASVYSEAEALAVISDGRFVLLQVAYNLLDRKMARRVFPPRRRRASACSCAPHI